MARSIMPEPCPSVQRVDTLPHFAWWVELFWALFFRKAKAFNLLGIDCSVNASVVVLPTIVFAYGGFGWNMVMYLLGMMVSLLLHEIGHAFGGFLVGNPAREICLTGFGGYTILSNLPGATGKDALISVFGPLTNAILVVIVTCVEANLFGLTPLKWFQILFHQVFGNCPSMHFMPESYFIINSFAIFNLYVVMFNLLPAFPLDGGRVVRWFLGIFLCSSTAAVATMFVSRACACIMVVFAVITDIVLDRNPIDFFYLILIAAWVWLGSLAEVWRTERLKEP